MPEKLRGELSQEGVESEAENPELKKALTEFEETSKTNEDLKSKGHFDILHLFNSMDTLVEIGGERAEQAIIDEYRKSDMRSEYVHLKFIEALATLAKSGHKKAEEELIQNFKEKSIGGMNKEASGLIRALGKSGSKEGAALLRDSLEKMEINFPAIAIEALGDNGDTKSIDLLKKEAQGFHRKTALEALGKVEKLPSGAIELLKQALWDKDIEIANTAGEALAKHPEGVKILESLVDIDNEKVAEVAKKNLEEEEPGTEAKEE